MNTATATVMRTEDITPLSPPAPAISPAPIMLDERRFAYLHQIAELMASGKSTIPAHLQGNVGDCFAIVQQATRWGTDPYVLAQKTYLVGGKLGYEAQLIHAIVQKWAPLEGRIQYEWFGEWQRILGKVQEKTSSKGNTYRVSAWKAEDEEGLGIRVSALLRGESEPRVLELLLRQAVTRNSTLWAEDPRQQLAYLAVKRWARLYCPDVILGMYSLDELEASAQRRRPEHAVDVTHAPRAGQRAVAFAAAQGSGAGHQASGKGEADRLAEVLDNGAEPASSETVHLSTAKGTVACANLSEAANQLMNWIQAALEKKQPNKAQEAIEQNRPVMERLQAERPEDYRVLLQTAGLTSDPGGGTTKHE